MQENKQNRNWPLENTTIIFVAAKNYPWMLKSINKEYYEKQDIYTVLKYLFKRDLLITKQNHNFAGENWLTHLKHGMS